MAPTTPTERPLLAPRTFATALDYSLRTLCLSLSIEETKQLREILHQDLPTAPSHYVDLSFHGVSLRFYASEELTQQIREIYPKNWFQSCEEPALEIQWVSKASLSKPWCEFSSADCHFVSSRHGDWVVQRDFYALKRSVNRFYVLSDDQIGDGFHNFLRFLLPEQLFSQGKILFHSSCILDESSQKAFLFYGLSGAGKTTISELISKNPNTSLLGDDMNLLSFRESGLVVEPCGLGQLHCNYQRLDQYFPVVGLYWLKQSKEHRVFKMPTAWRQILSSFAGLFWDQLPSHDLQSHLKLAHEISQGASLFQLQFAPNKEVWHVIQEDLSTQSRSSLAEYRQSDHYS